MGQAVDKKHAVNYVVKCGLINPNLQQGVEGGWLGNSAALTPWSRSPSSNVIPSVRTSRKSPAEVLPHGADTTQGVTTGHCRVLGWHLRRAFRDAAFADTCATDM